MKKSKCFYQKNEKKQIFGRDNNNKNISEAQNKEINAIYLVFTVLSRMAWYGRKLNPTTLWQDDRTYIYEEVILLRV